MTKRDLIVFGEDWGTLPSSTQHLIKNLADERRILWVNSIGLRFPKLQRKDLKRLLGKLVRFIFRRQNHRQVSGSVPKNVTLCNPLTIPAPSNHFLRKLATRMLKAQLQPILDTLELNAPILWTSLPTAADLAGELNESATVYYCGDDFASLAGVDHQVVAQYEKSLVERSDLIIAASQSLYQKFPKAKTRVLNHGVDFALFSETQARAADLPDDGKPIAGFYGSLSSWLDLGLLSKVIAALPHWNFVFIGKEDTDLSCLKHYRHVFFLGPKAHTELPCYSQHWQASLLPFRDTPQIRHCNPLKLREYIAAGTPVVSTPFPAMEEYRDIVQCAANHQDFVAALENSLHLHDLPHFSRALKSRVAGAGWQANATRLASWLDTL